MKPLLPLCLPVIAVLSIGASSPGSSAAHARHDKFEEIGRAFKQVTDQLKRRPPDFAKAQRGAALVAALAPQVGLWFPAGSGPQDGIRTDAKAEIWTNRAEFSRLASRFAESAPSLKTAADARDAAALAASVRTVGATCKSCHDQFRK